MKTIEQFFLYCSGADFAMLEKCPSDRNKFVGIGATIFFTGLFAFFSAGYALYTVFDSAWAAIPFGMVWGMMIFNLDRYIVMSMKRVGSWFRDALVALPRLGLALLLAVVISKPLEMKIFEKEIQAELVQMEQEVFKDQENQVKARFNADIDQKKAAIAAIKAELVAKTAARDSLEMLALQEADGTGGSRQRNLGPIYQAKKSAALQAQQELDALAQTAQPTLVAHETDIRQLESNIQAEIAALKRGRYDGLAARMEALSRLSAENYAIYLASLFITLLFMAIETAPILVKLISYRSPYDHLLHEHEHVFEMATLESTTLRRNEVRNKLRYNTEAGQHLTQAKITMEKALIDHKLAEKLAALKQNPYQWKPEFE